MIDKNEKIILLLLKYLPSIFIIIVTVTSSIILYKEYKKNILEEKLHIEKTYIKESKDEIKNLIENSNKLIEDIKRNNEKKLEKELKNHVNNSYMTAYTIFNKYKNSKSEEEIKVLIKDSIKNIRFNNDRGYLFIYELNGKNILNSQFPDLEGKSLWNYQDLKGTYLLQEMNKILQEKSETYYTWYWKKVPNSNKEYKKLGFFKLFEPYDWFIGTGEYYDDYSQELKESILYHIRNLRYENEKYIFIFDKTGTIITNKDLKLIGSNMNQLVDFKEYLKDEEALEKGIFINYTLSSGRKTSYIKLYKEWDWIIGTGFNLDSANKIIKQRQNLLEQKYNTYFKNLIIISIILILFLLIISSVISKYIEKIFYEYKSNLEKKNKTLIKAQETAHMGDWNLEINSNELYLSNEILKILGIDKEEQINRIEYIKNLMNKDDVIEFQKLLDNSLKSNDEQSFVFKIVRATDKKEIWIDCKWKRNHYESVIYGTILDITKSKKLEEEKSRQEALLYQQSKMAAMGEMLGNIAHQWRQPLSVISTAATGGKFQNELGVIKEGELNLYFDTINNTAQHLSQTIEDFRTFFDPNQNKISDFLIAGTIEKALNLVSAQFIAKDIEIIKDIDEIQVTSAENELIQALVNILNNSRDALLENVVDKKRYIFIRTKREENKLSLEIYDNAGGIKDKIINRVFEPYFTTKHKAQGTGIGLYMTREIVTKILNGEIYVNNLEYDFEGNRYKGAKFTIRIDI